MNDIKNNWKKWTYWFFLAVSVIIVYKILDNFGVVMGTIGKFLSVISPFFIGTFIAYLLYMPCRKIENVYKKSKNKFLKRKARGLSVITVYLIVLLIMLILFNFILPVVVESIIDLFTNIQYYLEKAISKYNNLPEDHVIKVEIVEKIIKYIQEIDIKQYFKLDRIFKYIMSAVSAVTSIVDVFVAIIVSVYILVQRTRIITFFKRFASAVFQDKTYKNIGKYFNNSNEIFFKFVASQFLDGVVVGIMITIAMSIMGIKFAPLLGFLIGIFNMIPYVGAIIAVGIAAIITLITGGFSQTIWMLIVVIILQQIDANIINPRIVSQSLRISPLLVIFAITVGGSYFGVLGMFLAVPIIAVIKILVTDYVDYKLAQKKKK